MLRQGVNNTLAIPLNRDPEPDFIRGKVGLPVLAWSERRLLGDISDSALGIKYRFDGEMSPKATSVCSSLPSLLSSSVSYSDPSSAWSFIRMESLFKYGGIS